MPLFFDLKVIPQSGRQKCVVDKNGTIKFFLKSPPEGGKANSELCKMVSKALRVSVRDVEVVFGATVRKKRMKIDADITLDDLFEALGIEKQMKIG